MVPSPASAPASPPPPTDDMSSLLIAALPTSIQSRIPKLPSLRRTVSMQSMFFRSESTSTVAALPSDTPSSLDLSSVSSAASSPPPSRPSTSAGPSSRRGSTKDAHDMGLVLASRMRQSHVEPLASDVKWKYAQNGFRNLQNALREAGDPDRLPELERQIYVESIAYLLRGLPDDLQEAELSQLRSAAPERLVGVSGVPLSTSSLSAEQLQQLQQQYNLGLYGPVLPPGTTSPPGGAPQKAYFKKRSLPHIATHWLVTKIYALILLLIPIVTDLARWAIEMERKYHIPEALLSCATTVALMVYRNSMELYVTVCSLGDGSVGRALDDGKVYLADGVVTGFREAVFDMARGQR
ncbi:hypothetical protein SPBR_00770 [Sporothrix brasiliensis 5110]|uniref:Uncharacterized protein n=1 Tax=Sporothrix brasiliensis 5110 TaxID=1398154 RepID=A0A0C2FG72_9PEZI|nr:uncharacterized protein SPBR_00770 [Sporothrix brasiliensis 5110]KIH90093.1 hypothetical protein SPBR_00770 [Sporothrix brasiliensis 5110]